MISNWQPQILLVTLFIISVFLSLQHFAIWRAIQPKLFVILGLFVVFAWFWTPPSLAWKDCNDEAVLQAYRYHRGTMRGDEQRRCELDNQDIPQRNEIIQFVYWHGIRLYTIISWGIAVYWLVDKIREERTREFEG
jgi:hypothetical protein